MLDWFDSFSGGNSQLGNFDLSSGTQSYNFGGGYTPNGISNLNFGGSSPIGLSNQGFNPNITGTGSVMNLESLGGIGGIANILAGLGNTWNGFQQQKLAKKGLNFQKDAFNRTFANNNKVYNQNMEDILRARSAQTGQNYDNIIAERRL